jgi:asparagine synthase (glutamine-hydrolysing)
VGAIAVFLPALGEAQPDVVARMAAAAPHRGTGVQTLVHGRCALACSSNAAMPDAVLGAAYDLAVAFVGSLDNPAELTRDLRRCSNAPIFDTGDDIDLPTLLAAGFRFHGRDLPARLRGVFAGAISDGERVFCFRDHIGYRPLFFRSEDRGFYAATEAKQVVAGARIRREPDLDVVDRIFFQDVDDDTPSALVGVRRLPKSTAVEADRDGVRLRRYWHPEALLETAVYATDELSDRFATLMDQAVSRCLTGSDVVSLSGGIDSPAVAAFAAPRHLELGGRPLHAFSVVYPKYQAVDESRYVAPLAEYLGLPLHTYEQTANPIDGLARWVDLADTPYPGAALAQYEEDYQRARSLGFRTVLTGEHAEFVFGMQWYTLEHYLTHGRFGAARRELSERRSRGRSWISLARLVAQSLAPDRLLAARNAIGRRPRTVPAWVEKRKATETDSVPVRERWLRSQLRGFIGPGISLEAEEVCQEVSGVRSRKPWTDVDLWEFFLSLRAEQKFPDLRPKGLVRDLLRGRLPDEILDRRDKTVFDDAMLGEIDYASLRTFLGDPNHRIDGVDYARLGELLRSERLTPVDYRWARNLANVHAFLSLW